MLKTKTQLLDPLKVIYLPTDKLVIRKHLKAELNYILVFELSF